LESEVGSADSAHLKFFSDRIGRLKFFLDRIWIGRLNFFWIGSGSDRSPQIFVHICVDYPLNKHVEIFVLKTVSNNTIKLTRKPGHFYQIQLIFKKKSDRIGGFGSDWRLWIGSARTKIGSDLDRIGRLLKKLNRLWIGSVVFWKDWIGIWSETDPIQLCRPLVGIFSENKGSI
jgi:hypothetical protein